MGALMIKFLTKFNIIRFLIKRVIPKIMFRTQYSKITGARYLEVANYLKEGDILLSVDNYKLTSFLIPGYWSHAGIVKSTNGQITISEMISDGYSETNLYDFCKSSDNIMVIRVDKNQSGYGLRMANEINKYINSQYDIEFEHGDKEMYCSELVAACDFENRLGLDLSKIITPDDIYKASIKTDVEIF